MSRKKSLPLLALTRHNLEDICNFQRRAPYLDVCTGYDVERLEAVSGELLKALKEILEQTDGRNNSVNGQARAYSIARAAIAKAEGTTSC